MINIAIIPARSGSKRLPDKNIKELGGIPLIAYSIRAAIESNCFERIIVSTDSEVYRSIAIKFGAEVPFMRSNKNSLDSSDSWDVVKEVISELRKSEIGISFRMVALLQPTSPLRTSDDIVQAVKVFNQIDDGLVISGYLENFNHLDKYYLNNEGRLDKLLKRNTKIGNSNLFVVNGAMYLLSGKYIERLDDFATIPKYPFIMDKKKSIDIDEEEDFKVCEMILNEKL